MITVFLAEGFEEIEALAPVDILRRAGLAVQTIGVTGKTVTGARGITVTADLRIEDAKKADNLRAVVLPGGMPGTRNLANAPDVIDFLHFAYDRGLLIAAICAAPSVIGRLGFLAQKRATCFPGYEKDLRGAVITGERVVRDGRFITGKGAGASIAFALEIVTALVSAEKADSIRDSLQ